MDLEDREQEIRSATRSGSYAAWVQAGRLAWGAPQELMEQSGSHVLFDQFLLDAHDS
jgi:hypothetical protein